jgi:enterochelin esterase-like enzyme
MHDGQNLFDPELSNTGIPWGVDTAIARLSTAKLCDPAIVVGIWCTAQRWAEYFPQRALSPSTEEETKEFAAARKKLEKPRADAYLRFLVREVKPFVDGSYRTRPERDATLIMGSSMGGLISLYAVCEYPDVFGGAGCLSTHWPAAPRLLYRYVKTHLPAAGRHRFYFDYGTRGLDAAYEPHQQAVDGLMWEAGYRPGGDWLTARFPGAEHNEAAWRSRLEIPLRFLL